VISLTPSFHSVIIALLVLGVLLARERRLGREKSCGRLFGFVGALVYLCKQHALAESIDLKAALVTTVLVFFLSQILTFPLLHLAFLWHILNRGSFSSRSLGLNFKPLSRCHPTQLLTAHVGAREWQRRRRITKSLLRRLIPHHFPLPLAGQ
jgi:uncharacterized membrane protein (GlpM family)